jgi:hypothetical protein
MKNGTCSKTNIMMYLNLCRGQTDQSEENDYARITSKKTVQVLFEDYCSNCARQAKNSRHRKNKP